MVNGVHLALRHVLELPFSTRKKWLRLRISDLQYVDPETIDFLGSIWCNRSKIVKSKTLVAYAYTQQQTISLHVFVQTDHFTGKSKKCLLQNVLEPSYNVNTET